MIKTESLTKKYNQFTALESVNINVNKGSIYGLVGPNGSGKTTLIKSLVGVYKPDAGKVIIDGEKVFEQPAKRIP